MKAIVADGRNYFPATGLPITVRYIDETVREHHPLDFTELRHTHRFSEIVVITKGRGTQWVEGYDFQARAGDVFFLQGDQEHYFKERDGLELYNVMFELDKLGLPLTRLRAVSGYQAFFVLEPSYRRRHGFKSRLHLAPTELETLKHQIKTIEEELADQKEGFDVRSLGVLIEIIVFLARQYSKTKTVEGKALLRLGEVISRLENNYLRDWTLPEIAKLAGMSKSGLLNVFREATGFTPIDYLIRLRIQHAMRLLSETSMSVGETAFESGFTDSNYFSRQFRRVTGRSPREFRGRRMK